MTSRELKEVLEYALGGDAPDSFLEHLLRHHDKWDEEFWRHIEACAYELRPETAVWDIRIDEHGRLLEQRVPLLNTGD